MTQIFIEYFYPGSFVSESTIEKRSNRNLPKRFPRGCYCFRFFETTEVKLKGEKLTGQPKNYSPKYFISGEALTLKQVRKKHPEKHILISNMEINKWHRIILTKFGQAFPLAEKDIILKPCKKRSLLK